MIMPVLHGPHYQGTDIIRHGTTRQGKQRYRCQGNICKGRTCLWDYTYAGHSAGVKHPICGMRDTARVLHVSPTTVIKELKNRAGVAAGASGWTSPLSGPTHVQYLRPAVRVSKHRSRAGAHAASPLPASAAHGQQ